MLLWRNMKTYPRIITKYSLTSPLLFVYFSAVIGEIDDDTDSSLDFPNIKAEPLNSVVH